MGNAHRRRRHRRGDRPDRGHPGRQRHRADQDRDPRPVGGAHTSVAARSVQVPLGSGVHEGDAQRAPDDELDHQRRIAEQQPLLAADPDQHVQRLAAQGRLDEEARQRRHDGQVLARGPADRLQRRHVRADGCGRGLRDGRRLGRHQVEVRPAAGPGHHDRLLWLGQPRRGDRRRQGLRGSARRARRGPRHGHRPQGLGRPARQVAGRLHLHARPAVLREQDLRRHLRRRVRHPRPPVRAGRQDRQGAVALLHRPGPDQGRPASGPERHVAGRQGLVEDGRRADLADAVGGPRAEHAVLLDRQRRPGRQRRAA